MGYRGMLYIVGSPGIGKSTLAAALVQGRRRRVRLQPFAHTLYEDGLVQLGRERADFSGTDVLSMSVSPKAIAALSSGVWDRVLGEGDRLAHASFFEAARAAGYELEVVKLKAPTALTAARREARGSQQSAAWLAGRCTKLANLSPFVTMTLDASQSVEQLVAALADHPTLRGT